MIRSFTKTFQPPFGSRGAKSLTFIPHHFDKRHAAGLILENDKNRLFAPSAGISETKSVVVSQDDPLKKVLLPFFYASGEVSRSDYKGKYGNTHYYPVLIGKQTVMQPYTVWTPVSGTYEECSYSSMLTYGGFTWKQGLVEEAFSGHNITQKLQPFDHSLVDSDIIIDPFHKRAAVAKEETIQEIINSETIKIEKRIKNHNCADDSRVDSLKVHFTDFKINSCLLPAYILQYRSMPPRIIPAIDLDTKIVGLAPVSLSKSVTAAAAAAGLFSLFFPQMGIPARAAMILAPSFFTGCWVKTRLYLKGFWNRMENENLKKKNDSVAETKADFWRRRMTENLDASYQKSVQILNIPDKYYRLLGLTPGKAYTEQEVIQAFYNKIKAYHPDHRQGSGEMAARLFEARGKFDRAFRNRKRDAFDGQKRHFATWIQEPPRSTYGPYVRPLIDTVLKEKNYPKALAMVEKKEIHPDAHDDGENTLLSEAARVGDADAVKFAIDDLGASPDTSCDCPAYQTPLHYAASCGHNDIVQLLLERKATVNLINSYGQTPLDNAIQSGHQECARLLKDAGGNQHTTIEGVDGTLRRLRGRFLGYGSSRTALLVEGGYKKSTPLLEKPKSSNDLD